ncbi:MAG TPA: ATP-binding protein [Candidatus Eisenbergiella merdipullorum]|uniref:ATP-binding protein n=1 Tax=Candidatus Eisenbergiella merdipullorum TaxID=2838553 RepID=A0A9D2KZG2_9FIRM|nr:ATP-binding protein [Candidatus Eisenbergiella merdipullorum]
MNGFKKRLPIGIENFEKIRKEDFYYVDKTTMIRNLLRNWGKVNLFTRPRRFGKSLNMSMLKAFLEIGCDKSLFNGLAISEEKAVCEEYMGQIPVISITLKNVEESDFQKAMNALRSVIGTEAMRFAFLEESDRLTENEKNQYRALVRVGEGGDFIMKESVLQASLKTLSLLLEKHYGKKVVILIDEYDVPLAKANERDYYDEMILLIRNLFGQALKTNDSLYFAVLTGCLRISKESIFTGLNNMNVLSIMDVQFEEYFGFSDDEVRKLLNYYEIEESFENVKAWYDGYRFGNVSVYCPWDVISYADRRRNDPTLYPEPYWINTSGNDIVRHLLEKASAGTRSEIERLIAGETVLKEIRNELTYRDIYASEENVWSVLFTTGYLTQAGRPDPRRRNLIRLAIPNEEIREIFINQIQDWMQAVVRKDTTELDRFCEALKDGEPSVVESIFTSWLERTVSIRDTAVRKDLKENFYHGFLLGILRYQTEWNVFSNLESGEGYTDIMIEILPEKIGIVIEMKYAEKGKLEEACHEAIEQIEEKDYAARLREEGMETILAYGIACFRKQCRVGLKHMEKPTGEIKGVL